MKSEIEKKATKENMDEDDANTLDITNGCNVSIIIIFYSYAFSFQYFNKTLAANINTIISALIMFSCNYMQALPFLSMWAYGKQDESRVIFVYIMKDYFDHL